MRTTIVILLNYFYFVTLGAVYDDTEELVKGNKGEVGNPGIQGEEGLKGEKGEKGYAGIKVSNIPCILRCHG